MSQGHTAFFYGTLMHPKILMRVIANDGAHLRLCPAILLGYTRHRVKDADYPGIVSVIRSEGLFKRELTREEKSVRGMLVTGLTAADMFLLDIFEGNEYQRRRIEVHLLGGFRDISAHAVNEDTLQNHSPLLPSPTELQTSTEAETYVYCDVRGLEVQLWSYEDFVKQNAWKWFGT